MTEEQKRLIEMYGPQGFNLTVEQFEEALDAHKLVDIRFENDEKLSGLKEPVIGIEENGDILLGIKWK